MAGGLGNKSIEDLNSFIRRAERLGSEIADLNADKAEVFKEAKEKGFDTKAMKAVIQARKIEPTERKAQLDMFDLYWSAFHGEESEAGVEAGSQASEASDKPADDGEGAGEGLDTTPAPDPLAGHTSDCAVHNAPAKEPGECDCGFVEPDPLSQSADDIKAAARQ